MFSKIKIFSDVLGDISFTILTIFFGCRTIGDVFGFFDYDWEMDMMKFFVFLLIGELYIRSFEGTAFGEKGE